MTETPREPEQPSSGAPDTSPKQQTATSEKSKIATMKEVLDVFGKLLFGLAGSCYVLGIVVVTIHLRQYGVNSLDLPQLQYVTAGVWVVLPIALIPILVLFGISLAAIQTEGAKKRHGFDWWVDRGSAILGIILALIFVVGFFWSKTGIDFSWRSVVLVPLLGILAAILILSGVLALKGSTWKTVSSENLLFVATLIAGLILFAAYLFLFAGHTYQSIPWATGGGRASQVRLVITPESKPFVESLNIALSAQTKPGAVETDSIKLLLTTEKQLVIINAAGKAVSLPSEIVKGITYEK